jgi:hypothetical protein
VRERTARERQPHRLRKSWLAAAAIAGVLWAGGEVIAWVRGNTVEARVRRTFGITGTVDTTSVRDQLLRRFPVGTPESRLKAYFGARQFTGQDGVSQYFPASPTQPATILVDDGLAGYALVWATYSVAFDFDSARRLRAIHVNVDAQGL